MQPSKIYVASSWRNSYQQDVVNLLRRKGHDVYDFRNPPNKTGFGWGQLDPGWKRNGGMVHCDAYQRMVDHPLALAGYASDVEALKNCDVLVYVLPCGRSASWEFGFAMGQGKPCYVLWLEAFEPELMFREATILGTWTELEAAFDTPQEKGFNCVRPEGCFRPSCISEGRCRTAWMDPAHPRFKGNA